MLTIAITSPLHVAADRSRLCRFVIDCDDFDRATEFWSSALDAAEELIDEPSRQVYRRLRLPDSDIRVLLKRTDDKKASKERMPFHC